MNIEDARRIAKLAIEHDAREAEIERIDRRLKHMPTNAISICIKSDAYVLDEFEISKDELSAVLKDMKHRREFLNRNLEKELDRYETKYGKCENVPWGCEDDLK